MSISHYLRQSPYCTGGQVSGCMVLAEADTNTFVGLWGKKDVMVLAVSIYLCFLKKKLQLLSCLLCMHMCKCTNFPEVGKSLKLL